MHELYQTYGAGELKTNPNSAFEMAATGPVVVMSRTVPKVVMVSPQMWNETARRLAYLERVVAGDAARNRITNGEYDTVADVDKMMES